MISEPTSDLESRIALLEQEVRIIKERNIRVEIDKKWEVSATRKATIISMTYAVATLVFYLINVPDPALNAFIPTLGYLLSTLSLPLVRRWWRGGKESC